MSISLLFALISPLLSILLLSILAIQSRSIHRLLKEQRDEHREQRTQFDQHQINSLKMIQDSLQCGLREVRQQITSLLDRNTEGSNARMDKLIQTTQIKLTEISTGVEQRLTSGFEKTTATFTNVVTRLAIIDQAQKKITELSSNVLDLQDILVDKRSRGVFGEVQLSSLIHNTIPSSHFSLQHTLSNGRRVDCLIFLPKPTGNIAIDAKFPLETYQLLSKAGNMPAEQKRSLEQQFRADIKKHINDIAEKYIIPTETADGAVLFIPAEAIFAEIHNQYPDLVQVAYTKRVWLVSPSTLMAILTTVRAVLKDEATQKQVHIIREHLIALGKDFDRFQKRMNNLARHIEQAHDDVEQVHKSSQKITHRFDKIEKVEWKNNPA